ncbi:MULTISPECIES: hypothetical protein [unclassified Halorubrum]|uniref:hypothetical protein n=1 Tax=unclassified Halorubrum TaxID=2642239 RepID=UPI0011C44ED1|nr:MULTISPECIES: hypothetical protein [unclassified Halorubrum]
MNRRLALLVALLCLGITVGSVTVGGQSTSDFALDSEATVTIPSQTVSDGFIDGKLEVDKTAVITPDESLTGTATVPDRENKTYEIQFRDSDESLIDAKSTTGAETTYEFADSVESPGSYGVNILDPDEGLIKSVLPVVIASHEVESLSINGSAPENAEINPSENVSVEASLTTLEPTSVESVTLTVWDDDQRQNITLTETADDQYEGNISSLEQGEYQTQVRIRGGEDVDGRPSLIGLSEAYSLTVTQTDEDSDNGGSDGDDGSSGSDGDDGSSGSDSGDGSSGGTDSNGDSSSGNDGSGNTSNEQTDNTNTSSGNESDTSGDGAETGSSTDNNSTDGETDSSSDTDSSAGGKDDDSTGTNGTTNEDETIEPNEGSISSDTSNDSMPLYAVQAILIATVVGAGLRRIANML